MRPRLFGGETARTALPDGVFWPIGAGPDGVWLAGFDLTIWLPGSRGRADSILRIDVRP